MSTLTIDQRPFPIAQLLADIRNGRPVLWWNIIALTLAAVIFSVLMFLDHRLLNGINVWDKPAKFALSLIVQMATVSWAISQLPADQQSRRDISFVVYLMTACTWLELVYIAFRASRAEASHFNQVDAIAIAAYALMGVGAVTLTFTAGYIGVLLWRARSSSLWAEAAGLGLMIGMTLATAAGGYMSSQSGHWVGGELTDAHGLGFFSWSTTGGDLRVAHFIGMHAAQIIPLAALAGRLPMYGSAIIVVLLTAATFAQAVMGMPLLAS